MKHLFVPPSIALLAKEKGFNAPCMALWSNIIDGGLITHKKRSLNSGYQNSDDLTFITAPIYQQIVDYLRDFNIQINVRKYDVGHYEWNITRDLEGRNSVTTFTTYYEAFEDALTYSLNLI